jgi:hypothetical protein
VSLDPRSLNCTVSTSYYWVPRVVTRHHRYYECIGVGETMDENISFLPDLR